jgi:hypothetical protein
MSKHIFKVFYSSLMVEIRQHNMVGSCRYVDIVLCEFDNTSYLHRWIKSVEKISTFAHHIL